MHCDTYPKYDICNAIDARGHDEEKEKYIVEWADLDDEDRGIIDERLWVEADSEKFNTLEDALEFIKGEVKKDFITNYSGNYVYRIRKGKS